MIAYSISWDDEIKILQRTALYYFNFILNWLNRSAWLTKTTTCSLYKKIYTKRNIFSLQLIWDYEVNFLQRKALILFYTNCYIVQLDHKDKKTAFAKPWARGSLQFVFLKTDFETPWMSLMDVLTLPHQIHSHMIRSFS